MTNIGKTKRQLRYRVNELKLYKEKRTIKKILLLLIFEKKGHQFNFNSSIIIKKCNLEMLFHQEI